MHRFPHNIAAARDQELSVAADRPERRMSHELRLVNRARRRTRRR